MKTTILLPLILLLVLAEAMIRVSFAATPAGPDIGSHQTLEDIRKKHDLPALAVVVMKDGQICDRGAVGVRKSGETVPVTTNDVFHIGSCTKSMTATVTARLI